MEGSNGRSSSRKIWGHSARERDRRLARQRIRDRILLRKKDDDEEDEDNIENDDEKKDDVVVAVHNTTTTTPDNPDWVRNVLLNIVKNFVSFFSLNNLQSHLHQFEMKFPISYLYYDDDDDDEAKNDDNDGASLLLLVGQEQLVSYQMINRFGPRGIQGFVDDHSTGEEDKITFYEYAVWLQRPSIIASLLMGGINPCIRDINRNSSINSNNEEKELRDFGCSILNRFFTKKVPLPMSSYVVTRVLQLRRQSRTRARIILQQQQQQAQDNIDIDDDTLCSICYCQRHSILRWRHDRTTTDGGIEDTTKATTNNSSSANDIACAVCELCLWKDILKRIETESEYSHYRPVVVCPVCGCGGGDGDDDEEEEEEEDNGNGGNATAVEDDNKVTASTTTTRQQRYEESRRKYFALPTDPKELYKLNNNGSTRSNIKATRNKRRREKRDIVFCHSWSAAVKTKVGLCQDIRREKFFTNVEDGNYHYVYGCVNNGIDLNLQNEYGQTTLFIASWRGCDNLVRLLLNYGSNPHICSNGGLGPLSAARANNHDQVIRLLLDFGVEEKEEGSTKEEETWQRSVLLNNKTLNRSSQYGHQSITTLIDSSVQHPGAGSYIIDDAVSDEIADALVSLWEALPTATDVKQKTGPCSVRSYYCDAERLLTSWLEKVICEALFGGQKEQNDDTNNVECCIVLSQMRFLHYSEAGLALPPHTDLLRVDHDSGRRSTHTFILYLATCKNGGATTLLEAADGPGRDCVLARVYPQKKRLLLFPHLCPHEGEEVIDVPKLLVRGEVILEQRGD